MNPYPKTTNGKHKMGMKSDGVKAYPMKRTPIKPVSKKQAAENAELKKLTDKLRLMCKVNDTYYRSELSGKLFLNLEPHHLSGRGKNLINPFTICMIPRSEHIEEQKHMGYEHKQELINKIRPIRLAQGFKLEDYE